MRSKIARAAVLGALAAALPATVVADNHWRGNHGDHRDMGRFHEHDLHRWASGHWYRGNHDGRWGWWWVVGTAAAVNTALWYSYAAPVYPYPDPYVPAPMVEAPPPADPVAAAPAPYPVPPAVAPAPPAVWYFCSAAGKYYPYVSSCPTGWKTVPAIPGGQ